MEAEANKPLQKIKPRIIPFLLAACMIVPFLPFAQDNAEREIRILLERPPNTLDSRQIPDGMARRIFPLITEQSYRVAEGSTPEDFRLIAPDPRSPSLHFRVVKDDLTRGVLYSRNETDVLWDTLSLSKTALFRSRGRAVLEMPGHHLSVLGFDLRNPVLAVPEVRRAIQAALPISSWAQWKYFRFVEPFENSGIPALDEARSLLDRAGFPPGKDGIRFKLRYLTTPVREGNELAYLVREALVAVGIRVEVIPLETSLFFSRLRRGDFDLFGSRMLRPEEGSPLGEWFRTGSARNYFGYSNPKLDARLRKDPEAGWNVLREWILSDLPCIPLFVWKHGLLLSDRVQWIGNTPPGSFDDSFRFLPRLQIK